jgi:hypothetical protein
MPTSRAAHAEPLEPGLSLLRWSAGQRLAAAAAVLAALWLAILLTVA